MWAKLGEVFDQEMAISGKFVKFFGGGDGIRTHDPNVANVVLSQLSYAPTPNFRLQVLDCGF